MFLAMSERAGSFRQFFENPIFLSSATSWFLAQVLKALIILLRSQKRSGREILEAVAWRTGGMPSSHAAMVSAMTTATGFREGVGSNLFVISFLIALIVMRDALGVRRSSGIQGRTLNQLGRTMIDRFQVEYHPVKEVYGHEPLDVVVGALLGIFIAAAYAIL